MLKTANVHKKLAMITLGATGLGSWYGLRGGDKKPESKPPINAGSSDEEKFIKYVVELESSSPNADSWGPEISYRTIRIRRRELLRRLRIRSVKMKRWLGVVYYESNIICSLAKI